MAPPATPDRQGGRARVAILDDLVPPARKRKIRLVVALSAAVLLACALVYTSLLSSSESVTPSDLVAAKAGADTSTR